jgi:hypothetical protein
MSRCLDLWHSSHESANREYSFFRRRFKVFLALARRECQRWAAFGGIHGANYKRRASLRGAEQWLLCGQSGGRSK